MTSCGALSRSNPLRSPRQGFRGCEGGGLGRIVRCVPFARRCDEWTPSRRSSARRRGQPSRECEGMRAVVAESADRLVWTEVPDVVPQPGEVLIKVAAAGVNRADLQQAASQYPMPPGIPETLGLEVAGVVADVGDGVTEWSIAQEVCALLTGGGYAEYVAAPAGQVMPIPAGVSVHEAAAAPEASEPTRSRWPGHWTPGWPSPRDRPPNWRRRAGWAPRS